MSEERPNKTVVRFTFITFIIGLICWTIALIGFGKYKSRYETSGIRYLTQAIIWLKYYVLDAIVVIIIGIQSVNIYNTKLKRVDEN